MKRIIYLSLILVAVALSACVSGKASLKRGNYAESVRESVARLRQSPKNKNARATLRQAYPLLKQEEQRLVDRAKTSANPLKWEEVLAHYQVLQTAHDDIHRSPTAQKLVNAQDYSRDIEDARKNAAEARYALGNQDMAKGHREGAKSAYFNYQKAVELRPAYTDAVRKMEEARQAATLKVQIQPIPMHSMALSLTNEYFENQMIQYFRSANISPFIQFSSAAQGAQPDQYIQMIFDDFVVGQMREKETVIQRDTTIQVPEIIKGKTGRDSTIYKPSRVKAEVHRFQRELNSSGLLDFRVIDARTGAVIQQQKFPGTFLWGDQWGFYQGQKEALSNADKQWIRKNQPLNPPAPQQLFIEFTKPIYTQVTGFVANYYSRF